MAELGFEALRKIQLQEKNYAALSSLEEGFYSSYKQYLEKQRSKLKEKFSLDEAKVFENTQRLLKDIAEVRQQKLLFKALRELRNGEVESTGLASEEKVFYRNLVKLLVEHEASLFPNTVLEKREEKQVEENLMQVTLLVDLPEFVGSDSLIYGPFKASQVIQLKKEDALLLIKKGVAEETKREFVQANSL